MTNSRQKGKRGELELAHYLTERGFPARRGQQFKGSADSPDVICPSLKDWHIECKRVEAGNPYAWVRQAKRDAGKRRPLVMHRKNGQEWVCILSASDFLDLILGIA
jgi:Holliday junction resolvase